MGFAVRVPGGTEVILEDLPLDALSTIETTSGVRWPTVLAAPASSALAAKATYEVACEQAGVEPELLTARMILSGDVFVEVDDSLPTMYEDGNPKAEDEPPISGSSSASDGGAGPPT